MDKFDSSIKKAKGEYMPSENFTKETMEKISEANDRKLNWKKILVPAFSGVLLLAVLVTGGFWMLGGKDQKTETVKTETEKAKTIETTPVSTTTTTTTKSQAASDLSAQLSQTEKEIGSGDSLDFSGYTMSDLGN